MFFSIHSSIILKSDLIINNIIGLIMDIYFQVESLPTDIKSEIISRIDAHSGDLINLIGGTVQIVREINDLELIPSNGKYSNLLLDASVYDVCEWVCHHRYILLVLVSNNAGGNVYFIPAKFACIETIINSIKISHNIDI